MRFDTKTSGYRQHKIMCQNTMLVSVWLSHQTDDFETHQTVGFGTHLTVDGDALLITRPA
jgi:hypothetical protein